MTTQQERFFHLLRVLRSVQVSIEAMPDLAVHFDMRCWLLDQQPLMQPIVDDPLCIPDFPGLRQEACGTAGCAIGWCCLDLWFMLDGLHLKYASTAIGLPVVRYDGLWSYPALARYFGISYPQAEHLFSFTNTDGDDRPAAELTIDAVIQRIETFVHEHNILAIEEHEPCPHLRNGFNSFSVFFVRSKLRCRWVSTVTRCLIWIRGMKTWS